ncbi:MAG: general secretion pathway protein D [Paracoccaceae bacterium]|jgi:general secretion pathway protein D
MNRSLTLLFGLSLGAWAQEPPTPGTPGSQPGVPTPVPAIQPVAPGIQPVGPAKVGGFRAGKVDPNQLAIAADGDITRANLTALEAAVLYEDHCDKRIIMTNAVAQSEVSFVIRGPLTNAEVAKFLKLILLGEGLAMIPIPGEPDIVRLVPSGPITAISQVPNGVFTDPFDLPADDEIVTYQMTLRYLKPEDALKVLQAAMGQLSASGNITAVPNASSLIITENSSLIRQMIEIKDLIDVPTPIGERWVDVTYGDVDEIAERMNEIYNEQASNRQTTRTTRTNAPPTPGSVPGAATSGEEIPIKIIGVRRTSRILLVGRPADLIAAEAMVLTFDQPSSENTRQTFRLRYLRVGDFLGIAESAISVQLGDAEGGGGQGGSSRQLAGQNNNSRNTQNNNNNNNNSTRSTGQQGQQGGGTQASIQAQDIPTAPESMLVGRTLLVGDNVANTIIVNGPPHHIEIVRDLIKDLDTESQQVVLSSVVGSYTIGDGLNFGVDLARAIRETGSSFAAGGLARFGNGVLNPTDLGDLGNILSANGGAGNGVSVYGAINDDFGFFVNALETQTRFKTLERTTLTTRNNRVASLSSGKRIAVPSSTSQGFNNNGTSTTNVEYLNVTLGLEIQPLINSDNQITLEISVVRDSVGANRTIGELIVPDINTESLTTSVTVEDGSAVILGGIITTSENETNSGIPILSKIPGIGKLFGSTDNTKNQAELIIMIQPRILKTQTELNGFRDDYSQSSQHTNEVAQSFPQNSGVLPAPGTMPRYQEPDSRGGVIPVRKVAPGTDSSSTQSKIRGRTGRPGRR